MKAVTFQRDLGLGGWCKPVPMPDTPPSQEHAQTIAKVAFLSMCGPRATAVRFNLEDGRHIVISHGAVSLHLPTGQDVKTVFLMPSRKAA